MRNKTIFNFFTKETVNRTNNDSIQKEDKPKCGLIEKIDTQKECESESDESDFFNPNEMLNKKTYRNESNKIETECKSRFIIFQPPNHLCNYSTDKEKFNKRIEDNDKIMKNVVLSNKANHNKSLFKTSRAHQKINNPKITSKPKFQLPVFISSTKSKEQRKELEETFEDVSMTTQENKTKLCSLFIKKTIPKDNPNLVKISRIFLSSSYKKKSANN